MIIFSLIGTAGGGGGVGGGGVPFKAKTLTLLNNIKKKITKYFFSFIGVFCFL